MDKGLYVDIDDLADELKKQDEIETEEKVEAKVEEQPEPNKPDPELEKAKRERDEANAKLAAEQSLRQVAEKLAADKDGEVNRLGNYALNADVQTLTTAINATAGHVQSAKANYKAAMEIGDYEKAAEAQEAIAIAAAELLRLKDGKAELEAVIDKQKKAPVETKKVEQPKTQTADDYINALPAVSKAWLSEHREYVDDPKLHNKMVAYSNAALAEGIKLHTPEHIKFLEDKLGISQPSDDPDEDDADVELEEPKQEAKPKARTMPAAPVSRGNKTYSSANPNGNRIRLSPALVAMAKEMGEDPAIYAKNALKGIKEGKLPKNFLDPDYNHNV